MAQVFDLWHVRHPAALPALALLAGAAIGAALPGALARALTIGLLAAWVACVAFYARRFERAFAASAVAGFSLAGAVLAADAQARALTTTLRLELDPHPHVLAGKAPVRLEGRLRQDAAPTAYGASLDLAVDTVSIDRLSRPVRGGVRLGVGGELAGDAIDAWRAGRRVRVWALLREPTEYRNPGGAGADDGRRLARQGTALVGSVKSARLVETVADGGTVAETAARARAFVRATMTRHVARRSAEAAGIVTAILIGDRAGLSQEVERRLQEAGTYHVIAISGGNIAILAGLLLALLRLAASPPRFAALVTIAGLAAYAVIVGDEASVERATLVAVLYLGARLLDHRAPPLNSLTAAAALLVSVAPLAIFDVGFVLSFGAAGAIVVGVPRIVAWLRDRCAAAGRPCPRGSQVMVALLAATLCAELALLPIAAYWFSRVTFAGFALNFAAIPLMTVAQIAGLATLVCDPIWTWAADRAGDVAWLAAAGLVESARGVELAPWLVRRLPPPPVASMAAYYAGWLIWFAYRRRPRTRRAGLVAVGIAGLVLLAAPRLPDLGPRRGWLRATFLDVAQGDATLVQFPNGRSLLVDAGGTFESRFDISGRVVAPALWHLDVRRLDYLAITHADPDHIAGAAAVVRDFRPRAIWEGVPVPREEALQRLAAEASARAIEWRQLQTGDRVHVGDVEILTQHPPPPDWERQQVRNDDSLVLEVRYGEVSILLTGDIGRDIEAGLASTLAPAALRVLKVPHHGSANSSTPEFIDAVRPALAVISAGKGNLFGHPAPVVLERYRAAGVAVLRTDVDGAVTIETDGRTVEIRTWTGRRMTMSSH